jgi:hypothetical protein
MGMAWLSAVELSVKVAIGVESATPWSEHGFSGADWFEEKLIAHREESQSRTNQPGGRKQLEMNCV